MAYADIAALISIPVLILDAVSQFGVSVCILYLVDRHGGVVVLLKKLGGVEVEKRSSINGESDDAGSTRTSLNFFFYTKILHVADSTKPRTDSEEEDS